MALKITRASDPITVDRLNLVIYAQPGAGKTSLAFTAEAPLLLDFDMGAHRAVHRKDTVRVERWGDIADMTADDLQPFKTIILDTAGRALDALTPDIISANPKHGRGGALTLQGFGELKNRFGAFLRQLNGYGKDVVLIAHMDEKLVGDNVIERIDMQGGSKGEVYKAADAMGRIVIENRQRFLRFSPTDAAFGKNPGQLEPLEIPHFDKPAFATFLGEVISRTKERMNALTESQREAQLEQEWFRGALPGVDSAEGINALLTRARGAGKASQTLLHERATSLGLVFDKKAGQYGQKVAA